MITKIFQYSVEPPRSGVVMIIPIAAPRNWFAPKRLAAEIPTKIGKNMNGAADISWIIEEIPSIAGYISSIDFGPKVQQLLKVL